METDLKQLNPLEVYKATVMVLSDRPQKPVDALFFFGRSFGDHTNLFETAFNLYSNALVKNIAIIGSEGERVNNNIPHQANPGKTWYKDQLIKIGVPEKRIFVSADAPDKRHTKGEGDFFLKLSKEQKWTRAVILAQPHQLLRAMLGLVKSMEQQQYWMEIYAVAPQNTNWHEVVRGSQGLEEKLRIDHVTDELARIALYQQTGDLASFEQLFDYYEKRRK